MIDFDSAVDIINVAYENDISISLEGERLNIKVKKNKTIDQELLQRIRDNKSKIISFLQSDLGDFDRMNLNQERLVVAQSREELQRIPLSFAQERLWFVDKLDGSLNYHVPQVLKISGALDREVLENAFHRVVERHEVLRTIFKEKQGRPYQEIQGNREWKMSYTDATDAPESRLRELIDGIVQKPFDLSCDFMLRAHLIRETADDYILVLVLHHIACDGWSLPILMNEVVDFYRSSTSAQTPKEAALPLQYADYAIWQRKFLQGDRLQKKLDFWANRLADAETVHLPTDFPRPAVQSRNGGVVDVKLSTCSIDEINELCGREGVSKFMLLLTVLKVMVFHYSGQEDVTVGSPVGDRGQPELDALIGFFVNRLALRSDLSGDPTFREMLEKVKNTVLDAYANRDAPFEQIVERIVQGRDLSRSPLFQHVLVFQNKQPQDTIELDDILIAPSKLNQHTSKFDLLFHISEGTEALHLRIQYCSDLFEKSTVERMAGHFEQLLQQAVATPEREISALTMVSEAERVRLLEGGKGITVSYPEDKSLVDLFEEQVDRAPEARAVVCGDLSWTYAELHERSALLANHLLSAGVERGDLIGITAHNPAEMLLGIWGILKAGAAYVPFDPSISAEQIRFIAADTKMKFLVTTPESCPSSAPELQLETVFLNQDWKRDAKGTGPESLPEIKPEDLAYLIYTSGTTGTSKAVMVSHSNVVDYLFGLWQEIDLSHSSQFGLLSTLSADLGNTILYSALLKGGTVHLFAKELLSDAQAIHQYFEQHAIDCIKLVPSHWRALSADTKPLAPKQTIIFGGEALKSDIVESLQSVHPDLEIVNHYGPTETTIGKLLYRVQGPVSAASVPIGRPFGNTETYVIDDRLQLRPEGMPGELLIGGKGVALGYLNRAELTTERFIAHPFNKGSKEKLYRTGDFVRRLPDGNIEFLGRRDDQVKIRGYRVELGEVAALISRHPLVNRCVVLASEDESGEKSLIAYVVKKEEINPTPLREALQEVLPTHLFPAHIVELEALPLNPNGKVDRKALAKMAIPTPDQEGYVPPRNQLDEQLAKVWREMLKVDEVGIRDNFFEVGGHSLLATRVISAIRSKMQVEVALKDLFVYPTIQQLSDYILSLGKLSSLPALDKQERPQNIPLSYSQERLWFVDKLSGSRHYHMSWVLDADGNLDRNALEKAFNAVVDRHEVLRTNFREIAGDPYQQIREPGNWKLKFTDLSATKDGQSVSQLINDEIGRTFDLTKDYMLRAHLVQVAAQQQSLVLVVHHIAADGWSIPILIKEVIAYYRAFCEGDSIDLKDLPIQYADYAIWQRRYLEEENLEEKLKYWEQKLAGVEPVNIPTDFVRPEIKSTRGGNVAIKLDSGLTAQVNEICQRTGATRFMFFLAALKVLLHKYTGQRDLTIGSPVSNRNQSEIEPLIGFFVNRLALRSNLQGSESFEDYLSGVKKVTLEAFSHREAPFEKVVERVVAERDLNRSPLFQVVLVFHNKQIEEKYDLKEVRLTSADANQSTSKFDLLFNLTEKSEAFGLNIQYSADLFAHATIENMAAHFSHLLQEIGADPNAKISALSMLGKQEQEQIRTLTATTQIEDSAGDNILDLFMEQVRRNPQQDAVIYDGGKWTYEELSQYADQLAKYLLWKGAKKGDLVALSAEDPHKMLLGIWGTIKAGCAYVPIDTSLPSARKQFILEDSNSRYLLIDSQAATDFDHYSGTETIFLDGDWGEAGKFPMTITTPAPEDLLYVIYTSGTTGRPKGVLIDHGNLMDYFHGVRSVSGLTGQHSFGLMSTLSADLGNTLLFGALLTGGVLHLFNKEMLSDADALHNYFSKNSIDCIKIVPSHWQALMLDAKPLLPKKLLMFGGEPLTGKEVNTALQANPEIEVINHYGPTETTIGKLLYQVQDKVENGSVPIGKPFGKTHIHIVDEQFRLCGKGVPGELLIGGRGVARGYLNQDSLTAEKFILSPFTDEQDSILYRTGDIVRLRPDGNVEFIGRRDDQVKIRGYRVELGAVQCALEAIEGIRRSVVVAVDDEQGQKRIAAYIVADEGYEIVGTKERLREVLPEHCLPFAIVKMDALPLTANGKINRKALPAIDGVGTSSQEYKAAETELEIKIAEIWRTLLKVDKLGVNDNFFELGGHSLLATRVVSAIRKELGADLAIRDIFLFPTIAQLADLIESQSQKVRYEPIKNEARPDRIPLSFSQERLWFVDQLEGSSHYHLSWGLRLKGRLNRVALEFAFGAIVNRHEVLRTVYKDLDGQAYQEVRPKDGWALAYSEQPIPEENLADFFAAKARRPFDLSKDFMIRAHLVRQSDDYHILVMVLHHIAADGWSLPILMKELLTLYRDWDEGSINMLEPLPIQYADYAVWQRRKANEGHLENQLHYWEEKLRDVSPVKLPIDFPRPAVQSTRGDSISFNIDKRVVENLKTLCKEEDVTLFMLLSAVFKVLLYRYSGQEDITFSSPIANRMRSEVEPLIGFFVNTIILRSDLAGNPQFVDLLQQIKATTLEAYANQEVPYERVVDRVLTARDLSLNPLGQIIFLMRNNPDQDVKIALEDLDFSTIETEGKSSLVDLHFSVTETTNGLRAVLSYCTDLYRPETIARMAGHFAKLTEAVASDKTLRVGHLPMFSEAEWKELIGPAGKLVQLPNEYTDLISGFEKQVALSPDAVALEFAGEPLTYLELDRKAARLAGYLRNECGVGDEDLVGLMQQGSDWSIISTLGILKAGAAFVPIDPSYPLDRKKFIIEDTGMKALIIHSDDLLDATELNVLTIAVDVQFDDFPDSPAEPVDIRPEQLAYVIYTSGSTGKPKGVMVEHRGVSNMVADQIRKFGVTNQDRVVQFASLSFDASVSEVFMALNSGSSLVMPPRSLTTDGEKFTDFMQKQKVSVATLPPAYLNVLNLDSLSFLRVIITAGEAASVMSSTYCAGFADVFNAYGPTECSVCVTTYKVKEADKARTNIPIGRPIANLQTLVLDRNLEPVPYGAVGELHVAGPGVARGYLNRPELSRQRFVPNPFDDEGTKLYKTGDLVKLMPNGDLIYLGRADEQVKIRGYRVELGEVESAIHTHHQIGQCAAVVKTSESGHKQLIAYLVSEPEAKIDFGELQRHLQSRLPSYMIPAHFITVEAFPLTNNGKVDKRKLEQMQKVTSTQDDFRAPRNETEEQLAEIWKELLGVDQVGIDDNFFELGGDSIISIQLVSRAKKYGLELRPRDIFEFQTIAKLSENINNNSLNSSAEQGLLEGEFALTPIQRWFLEKDYEHKSYFNQSTLFAIDKSVEEGQLSDIFEKLLRQHDVLRLSFSNNEGIWTQSYNEEGTCLNTESLADNSSADWQAEIAIICNKYQRSLNIETGEVIRAVLIETPEGEAMNRFFLVAHHLVIDGVSWRILLNQFQELLAQMNQGENLSLGPKTTSFRQWSAALTEYTDSNAVQKQANYWQETCDAYSPLPVDRSVPEKVEVVLENMAHCRVQLPKAATEQLLTKTNHAYGTEINDLLLAALLQTINEWSQQESVVIGLEGHGREYFRKDIDLSNTLGWFTTVYPLCLRKEQGFGPADLIKSVKEQLRAIPKKGIGYGLLRYLDRRGGLQRAALANNWELEFNYLGQVDNVLTVDSLLGPAPESRGGNFDSSFPLHYKMALTGIITGGCLELSWRYSTLHYNSVTVEGLAAQFIVNLENIITHCSKVSERQFTPSDYGLAPAVHYQELAQFLKETEAGGNEIESLYPLSPLQKGFLFHYLYNRKSEDYVEQMHIDFPSGLDLEAIRRAFSDVYRQYSILRSGFITEGFSSPIQCVYKEVEPTINVLDFSHLSEVDGKERFASFLEQDFRQPFDFSKPPIMRMTFIKMKGGSYKMIWTFHHILLDGWSMPVLVSSLRKAYSAYAAGTEPELGLPDRYEDYIRYIENKDEFEAESFWRRYCGGLEQKTLLPFVESIGNRNKGGGNVKFTRLLLSDEVTESVREYGQRHQVTVNTVIQGIWSFLLSKYTGNDTVVFGATVSGRPPEMSRAEERVGLFINTIPLCVNFTEDRSIVSWLKEIQKGQTEAREFQYTSLNTIQGWIGQKGELFDSIFVFENYPIKERVAAEKSELEIGEVVISEDQTNYPVGIKVSSRKKINIKINYNSDLIEDFYAEMIKEHFESVLLQILELENASLSEISVISDREKQQLIGDFNDTDNPLPPVESIVSLFEKQVRQTPDNVAVSFQRVELTYAELNRKANLLAHYLQSQQGVGTGDLVGIMMPPSEWTIVSILGILKCGAAYVPIDSNYPDERKSFIVSDTNMKALIVESGSLFEIMHLNANLVAVDIQMEEFDRELEASVPLKPQDLAYVIYTSGTSGKPKGVLIEHLSLLNYLTWALDFYRQDHSAFSFPFFTSLAFDLTQTSIYLTLLSGGQLVVEDGADTSVVLRRILANEKINAVKLTPSHILLSDAVDRTGVGTYIVGGEELLTSHVEQLRRINSDCKIYNEYGPTEATIGCTVEDIRIGFAGGRVSIGRPINNTQIYVLDKAGHLVPCGVPGELHIAGKGLARGYLNRPELTAEKFITSPIGKPEGNTLYKTGDLARWLPDGTLEFLGRIDDQVKIRGYRVELDEIRTVLETSDLVQQALVLAQPDAQGSKRLVAYLRPGNGYDKAEVLKSLRLKLPDYMVPGLLVELDHFPLTHNGKIDKAALPIPDVLEMVSTQYVAPRNKLEEKLAVIWKAVLDLDKLGVYDDFFEIGGHSLSAIRLVAKINLELSTNLDIAVLFEHPSIDSLAAKIAEDSVVADHSLSALRDRALPVLSKLNNASDQPNLFCLPTVGGQSFTFLELAKQVEPNFGLYAFNAPGINGIKRPLETVKEMADLYLKEMTKVNPDGPYILIGYSFGAKVLCELLENLRSTQMKVSHIFIIDASIPYKRAKGIFDGRTEVDLLRLWLKIHLNRYDKVNRLKTSDLEGYSREEQVAMIQEEASFHGIELTRNFIKGAFSVWLKNHNNMYYLTGTEQVDIPVTLFATNEERDYGWSRVTTAKVNKILLEGDHFDVLKQKSCSAIAKHIRENLQG